MKRIIKQQSYFLSYYISESLRKKRIILGITHDEIAEATDITIRQAQNYENYFSIVLKETRLIHLLKAYLKIIINVKLCKLYHTRKNTRVTFNSK